MHDSFQGRGPAARPTHASPPKTLSVWALADSRTGLILWLQQPINGVNPMRRIQEKLRTTSITAMQQHQNAVGGELFVVSRDSDFIYGNRKVILYPLDLSAV